MDERREVLHAIELSLAASLWAENVCLGLMCTHVHVCVYVSAHVYVPKKTPTQRCVQPLPAAACGCTQHTWGEHGAGTREDRKRDS